MSAVTKNWAQLITCRVVDLTLEANRGVAEFPATTICRCGEAPGRSSKAVF